MQQMGLVDPLTSIWDAPLPENGCDEVYRSAPVLPNLKRPPKEK